MATARSLVGKDGLQKRSYIHAHGTGTPQNRVTESEIMNELAKTFGITNWPVAAVKAYLGHTLAPAAGDQLTSALGTWKYGLIPGIATIDHLAEDVHASHLTIGSAHIERSPESLDWVSLIQKDLAETSDRTSPVTKSNDEIVGETSRSYRSAGTRPTQRIGPGKGP
ncbi:MAG: hypothetical protein CM1200mP9_05220 [Gammaproteobacteria bacterium]|nr:MAG: hypothetical protein CM1200mP9_05220 [Gammaproteobacteria bacterium]